MGALDRIHVYAPLDWQRNVGYSETLKLPNGKPQCRAAVSNERWGFRQCSKPGHVEIDGVWVCRAHDPEAVAARDAAATAKYHKQMQANRLEWGGPRFAAALQKIAAGHNDPRTVAIEALGDLYDPSFQPDSAPQSEAKPSAATSVVDAPNPIPMEPSKG